MRRPPTTLLDLGRKFRDDEDRLEDWEAVLKYPYVVVLGEAGTGKSSEFRLRQQRLAADGHFAFFVEISELANSGLVSNVDIDDESRIAEWQNSQCDAVFFLDSLDEAKLRNNTLQQALRRLQRELRGQWDRVRLVVSCRPSDWMAEADREVLQSVAPPGVSNVHVVKLAPLDPSQVGRLAQAAGVVDVGRLMEAVADSDAYVFVERPLDVQWLGSYWVRHQRFGSLRELIEDNVREKLKESPDRPSMLPLKKAEEGIETLAGVATINNTWSFVVPEPGASLDVQRASGSMEPQDFLRDWSSVEVGELLRRPVFDEATYGRVRLHHRTVQEFLAARWLYGLISSGLAHARVEEIFLRGGAIPAHLGPVAAWLALWDEEIRRLLIREAPLLLIGHGDPSGFRDDVRREILRAYASSYNGRKRLFETFDHASLQRFATPALADQIKALLAGPDVQDDLVWFLLQVVEYGRIVACADICVRLALDLSRSDDVRFRAIRAVASVGSDADRSALLALLHSTSTWDQDVAGAFVDTLYPALLVAQGLMDLLKIVEPKRRNVTTSLQLVLQEKVPEKGSVELRLELLTALLHVVWVPDATTGLHAVPSEEQWLFPLLDRLVAKLLDELPDDGDPRAEIVVALSAYRWCNKNKNRLEAWYGHGEVKKAIARHPALRRFLFWQRVEVHRQTTGSTPTRYFKVRDGSGIFQLSGADRSWLGGDARTRTEAVERLLAFDALSCIPGPDWDDGDRDRFLRDVADAHPELTRRWNRTLNPRDQPSEQQVHWDRRRRAGELRRRAGELRQERQESKNKAVLEECIETIRNGSHTNNLVFLYEQARGGIISSFDVSAETLAKRYGDAVAEAAIAGWRAFWRSHDPLMPHERADRSGSPNTFMG